MEEDEFELNYRKCLNYGHTIGHAIETLSNYKIPHGQAVIIGMVIVNKIAEKRGILNEEDYELTRKLALELLGKSIIRKISLKGLLDLLKKDKKTKGHTVDLVVISKLGTTKFLKTEVNEEFVKEIEEIIKEQF